MRAGRILKLAGNNYIQGLAEHHREVATKQLNVVLSAAETFNAELAAVGDDTTLSPEGRAEEAKKVATAALAKLASVDIAVTTLTERTVTLEATLLNRATPPPPKDPAERLAYELHLQEIRSQLRGLSLSERTNVYRTSTDPLVLAAIETAPNTLSAPRPDGSQRLEPFVGPTEMSAVRLERAEKNDPVTATTLREVKSLAEVYRLAVNGVRKEILDEVSGVEAS